VLRFASFAAIVDMANDAQVTPLWQCGQAHLFRLVPDRRDLSRGTMVAFAITMTLLIVLGVWVVVSIILCLALVGMAAKPLPSQKISLPQGKAQKRAQVTRRKQLPAFRLRKRRSELELAVG
jgi:hypothetical protein